MSAVVKFFPSARNDDVDAVTNQRKLSKQVLAVVEPRSPSPGARSEAGGGRVPLSQRHRLSRGIGQSSRQVIIGYHVGREASESLNVIDEQSQVEQISTGRRGDEEIDVRIEIILPSDG